jgi:hypothetical protein
LDHFFRIISIETTLKKEGLFWKKDANIFGEKKFKFLLSVLNAR